MAKSYALLRRLFAGFRAEEGFQKSAVRGYQAAVVGK
jgi:hypothetical protein